MGEEEGLADVIGRLKLYALVAVAFFLGVLGMRAFWIDEGVDREKAKRDQKRLDDMHKAKEVEDEVEILDDVGLGERASKWVRQADK